MQRLIDSLLSCGRRDGGLIARRSLLGGMALLGGLLLAAGCQPTSSDSASGGGLKRIVLLNNTDSPFWDAARAGIAKAVEELQLEKAGFTAGLDTNDGSEQGQIEKLRQYGTQNDVAAVIISPISASNPAIADELKKLKEKGILIGCF
ncbi:MAG: hypothetical protein KDA45_05530, partial [Planctomycetales bacterium]|nr:hypothetical protein [Planctomycetales bacterium]